jgi:hypothetical protein
MAIGKVPEPAGGPANHPPPPVSPVAPRSFAEWLGSARAPPPAQQAAPARATEGNLARAPPGELVRALFTAALDVEREIDAVLAVAGRGGTFTAQELLALQAQAFRYSQTVEILSRATDRLLGALRQTLGTQL